MAAPEAPESAARAFDAADIRRNHRILDARRIRGEMPDKQGAASRCTVAQRKALSKAAEIVHVEGEHPFDAHRFE